jgi:16S rRNA (adenine1518-N6/adenine1519-N6)-dimethyltransferase
MKFAKKSLGQNFLVDKNIIRKIINSVKIENRHVIEIGPGHGALTNEILKLKPKSLSVIEKDFELFSELQLKYKHNKKINVFNNDILKFDLRKVLKNKLIIFGNLPYNISSQILIKIIKLKKFDSMIDDMIFMFQKELGEKIICRFPSKQYGRLSIISNYKLSIKDMFLVSPNCFYPKPKVNSMVIHFKPKRKFNFIKNLSSLEKVTNILFSNKRKMINKNIKKLLTQKQIKSLNQLDLKSRPTELNPEIYYKITKLYEKIK